MKTKEEFSAARSILNKTDMKRRDFDTLWSLIKYVQNKNKEEYNSIWLDYLHSYKSTLSRYDVKATKEHEPYEYVRILPFIGIDICSGSRDSFYKSLDKIKIFKIINSPCFENLTGLDFSRSRPTKETINSVLIFDRFKKLKTLNLELVELDRSQIEFLAKSNIITSIKNLNISATEMNDDTTLHFLNHIPNTGLRGIDISDNNISDLSMIKLLNSERISKIRKINMQGNRITERSLAALFEHKNIEEIFIGDNRYGDDFLSRYSGIDNVSKISIRNTNISEVSAKKLAYSTLLRNLIYLDISESNIDSILPILIKASGLVKIRHLVMSEMKSFSSKSLMQLSNIISITKLNISNNAIDDDDFISFTSSGTFSHLSHLDISNTHQTDRALLFLSQSESFPALKMLSLKANNIDDTGVKSLLKGDVLQNVEHLDLESNRITWVGLKAILESSKSASLTRLNLRNNPIHLNSKLNIENIKSKRLKTLEMYTSGIDESSLKGIIKSRDLPSLTNIYPDIIHPEIHKQEIYELYNVLNQNAEQILLNSLK